MMLRSITECFGLIDLLGYANNIEYGSILFYLKSAVRRGEAHSSKVNSDASAYRAATIDWQRVPQSAKKPIAITVRSLAEGGNKPDEYLGEIRKIVFKNGKFLKNL